MSSDRKIVLHTGLPKTGTSTIQNVFHENREFLLAEEGVLYPSLEPNLTTPFGTIFKNDPRKPIANKMAGFTIEVRRNFPFCPVQQFSYGDRSDATLSSGSSRSTIHTTGGNFI